MKRKFLGANTHRFSTNPLEKKFAKMWSDLNNRHGRGSILEYILSTDGGKTLPETSERDEMIAASIIQWFGTPVGKIFLDDLNVSAAAWKRRSGRMTR